MLRTTFLIASLYVTVLFCALGFRVPAMQTDSIRRVTNTLEVQLSLNPSLSGDGRHMAFESNADLAGTGGEPRFRAFHGLFGSEQTLFIELGETRAISPAVSQDGGSIAFASKEDPLGSNLDGNSEIFLYSSGLLRQITNTLPDEVPLRHIQGNFQPSITDDGMVVAFASNRNLTGQNGDANLEIFLYNTITSSFGQLTNSTATIGAMEAKISGDGSHIAYIEDNGATPSGFRDLVLETLTTGGRQTIGANLNELALTKGRAISDDGLRVVYAAESAPGSSQVFLYDGRNNVTRQLTSMGVRDADVPLHPTISGDGKRISFATRRNVLGGNTDNSVELYVLDLPTAQLACVTNAPASATAEVISSLNDDGSLVAFNFPRVLSGAVSSPSLANNSEIYVAAIEPRPPYSSGLAVMNGASFGHEPYSFAAVAPDSVAVATGNVLAFSSIQAQPLPNGGFPMDLGGTTVTVNNRLCQLFSVSPTHVSFHIPPETETAFAEFVVTNSEGFQTRGTARILSGAPGVFTETQDGVGAGLIRDAQTGQPGPFDPSGGTQSLVIFATGVRRLMSQTNVNIAGRALPIESISRSEQTPGMDLIRVHLPRDFRGAGNASLSVRAGRRESNPVSLVIGGSSSREVFVNEVLADPADGIEGDANHDGVRSGAEDEFIELVNAEPDAVSIAGWTIRTHPVSSTTETTRHTFATGSMLGPRDSLVLFGGGLINTNHPAFGGAQVQRTSSAGLSLTNSGLTIIVRDAAGNLITEFSYGGSTGLDGNANQSLTRAPDFNGNFVLHTQAAGARGRLFSPGTLADGTFFVPHEGVLTSVGISPSSLDSTEGNRIQITARSMDQFGRVMRNANISFSVSEPAFAVIESVRVDRRLGTTTATLLCLLSGTAQIRATSTGGVRTVTSSAVTLTIAPPPPVIARIEVSPLAVEINRGQSQQLTAVAFDPNNQVVPGVIFQWSSSDPIIAEVNQAGAMRSAGVGRTIISASALTGTGRTVSGQCSVAVRIPLVINEVLADVPPDDPATPDIEGDANRDGTRNSSDDEFVEVLNNSTQPVDISGVVIADATSNRFTFPSGTIIPAGRAMVIFGGGSAPVTDPAFGGSYIFTAASLGLNDSGDTVFVKFPLAGVDVQIGSVSYGDGTGIPAPSNQSMSRSPDAEIDQNGGAFVAHSDPPSAEGRPFSPGTRIDGTPFGSPHVVGIELAPSFATINPGESRNFTARAIAGDDPAEAEIPFVSFTWDSSDTSKATVSPSTGAITNVRAIAPGVVTIRARAGGQIRTAVLTINSPPQILTRIDVSPTMASVLIGGTSQFVARGYDQNNMEIPGLVYVWRSSNEAVATINQVGIATGIGIGTTEITATSAQVISNIANLNVASPQIPSPGEVIVNEALVSFAAGSLPRVDFVELYNTTSLTLDISGMIISYRATGATSLVSTVHLPGLVGSGTTLVSPNSYFLIANGPSTFGVNADFDASSSAFDMNNSSGAVKIEINGVKIDGLRYQQNGSGAPPVAFDAFGEGALFTFAGGTPNDLLRSPNAVDTNNNLSDFRRNNSHATVSPKAVNPTIP